MRAAVLFIVIFAFSGCVSTQTFSDYKREMDVRFALAHSGRQIELREQVQQLYDHHFKDMIVLGKSVHNLRDNLQQIVAEFEFLTNNLHGEFQASRGRTVRAFNVLMKELAKRGMKIDLIKAIEWEMKRGALQNKQMKEKKE